MWLRARPPRARLRGSGTRKDAKPCSVETRQEKRAEQKGAAWRTEALNGLGASTAAA